MKNYALDFDKVFEGFCTSSLASDRKTFTGLVPNFISLWLVAKSNPGVTAVHVGYSCSKDQGNTVSDAMACQNGCQTKASYRANFGKDSKKCFNC